LLAALLLTASAAGVEEDFSDRIELGDGRTVRGRILECSEKGIRFVPPGQAETMVPPSAVRSVSRAGGQPCNVSSPERRSSIVPGVIALVVLPIAGFALGATVGKETCSGAEDQTPCMVGGALVGAGAGLLLGTVILVGTTWPTPQPAAAEAAGPGRRTGRGSRAFSVSIHF
jgi:hypothetical protein